MEGMMVKMKPKQSGMKPDSPHLSGTSRARDITSRVPIPNWQLIYNGQGLSEDEIMQRWAMIQTFHTQMINSPRRRLIPQSVWDELVEHSSWMAIYRWKGNGVGKCPIKNYTWLILKNIGIAYWDRHKHEILSIEIDSLSGSDRTQILESRVS
jgi:hypothetical protein